MADYIARDEAKNYIKNSDLSNREKIACLCAINNIPAVNVAPVTQCKWVCTDESAGVYNCSACDGDFLILDGTPAENDIHYCPFCGAKMDLEE